METEEQKIDKLSKELDEVWGKKKRFGGWKVNLSRKKKIIELTNEIKREHIKRYVKKLYELGIINLSALSESARQLIKIRYIEMKDFRETEEELKIERDTLRELEAEILEKLKKQ